MFTWVSPIPFLDSETVPIPLTTNTGNDAPNKFRKQRSTIVRPIRASLRTPVTIPVTITLETTIRQTTRATRRSNSGSTSKSSNLSTKLRKDGKLTQQERQRHFKQNLCMFCGKVGHIAKDCHKAIAAKARSASTNTKSTDKTSDVKSSESKNQ